VAVKKPDVITQLPDGGQEHAWNEPQWFGIWKRFDGSPTEEWSLTGVEPGPHTDELDVLLAEFQATRWSEAKATFNSVTRWAVEGATDGPREWVNMVDLPVPRAESCAGSCALALLDWKNCQSECRLYAADLLVPRGVRGLGEEL
jgi:hypothetical protein